MAGAGGGRGSTTRPRASSRAIRPSVRGFAQRGACRQSGGSQMGLNRPRAEVIEEAAPDEFGHTLVGQQRPRRTGIVARYEAIREAGFEREEIARWQVGDAPLLARKEGVERLLDQAGWTGDFWVLQVAFTEGQIEARARLDDNPRVHARGGLEPERGPGSLLGKVVVTRWVALKECALEGSV